MGKKAAGKGKKGKAAKAPPVIEPPKFSHPEFKPARLDSRVVQATIKLAAPVCTLLEFTKALPPTTKISHITDLIVKRHGGSIREVSVCVNRFHPEEIIRPDETLEDCGITGGECVVYYDFVPLTGALLQ
ncbi:conserved hypothetical protein [Perkinsus marinus ATCC 50983]|uniref:Ubiquitin-like domain-containing protein n=1 Tax=Perkinsus marinus (strain ATCC 50983 / TXsc) TaxID=423536 RepID=C5K9L2_PERM5|nr:conserved hypothetical protein [Perkinsus marinus ATCC 50983]EER18784.1 conserved hypothetical protein [Perkinsus marinus ATCC 50983]|eukprot:XP_002786988.1 conserved hypothetical protein [Perkinsus marinus ATCC 50983]